MSSWLEELEARLDQQLEGFLRTNPQQEELLRGQAARDRQKQLLAERVRLRQQAEEQRKQLLKLAEEIRQWQERIGRARNAGAGELAGREGRAPPGLPRPLILSGIALSPILVFVFRLAAKLLQALGHHSSVSALPHCPAPGRHPQPPCPTTDF